MSLYSLSIRRPVLSTVFALLIMIFGAVGFYFLGVREYPAVDPPIISVSTQYRGANADVIDSQITEPLEEQINGIDGIRTIESVSREGQSTVTVEFDLGADLERAANDVRDRVSRAQQQLPPDAEPPSVSKSDASAPPIVFLNIESETRSLMELTEIADKRFKERLQTIEGVSRVDIWGEKTYSMRLELDPQKLAAYDLTPLDVRQALDRSNVELPSGRIEGETIELTVRTKSRLETVEDFNSLLLKQSPDGQTVRLEDVGKADIAPLNERTLLQRDNVPMVGVVLRPLPGANYINIVDEFYRRVDDIKAELPSDLELGIGFDNTEPIRDSISEVQQTIFIAFLLVVLIIFLFLRDWRSTIIPLIVVPIALTGSFFVMYAMGFSINVLTLLALVLAIGLVVDDAIVVLENIYAKIEEGKDTMVAGLEGTREIFFAVVATSVSLVIIFAPIIFMGGLTGQLFQEFGMVIAGAVAFSSFVALTLTPMLSTRLLKQRDEKPWIYRKTEPVFESLTDAYRRSLEAFMEYRWAAFVIMAGCIVVITTFHFTLPQELAPLEDRSLVRMNATAREGATYDYMSGYVDKMYEALNETVPAEHQRSTISVTSPGFGAASSVNSAFMFTRLVPPGERDVSQMQYADSLQAALGELEGARTFVSQEPTISVGGGGGGLPVQYVLQTSSVENLREALPTFLERARQQEELGVVDVNLKFNKPELQVEIDRDRANNIGVSPLDVAQTLQLALAEQRVGYFVRDGEQRQILATVDEGGPRRAGRPDEPVRPVRERRAGAARQPRVGERAGHAAPNFPLQPLHVRHRERAPGARQHDRGRHRGDGPRGGRRARPGVLDHPHRPVARLPGDVEPAALRLRAGARPDLPGPCGPVRELPRPARHPLHRAAGPGGGDAVPLVLQPDDQHLQPDRHGDADRAGGEEWHPHRRVCEPAQGRGPVNPGGHRGGGGGALPAHPHDRPLHDPRRAAHCAGAGGGGAEPCPNGGGRHWRAPRGHRSLALRDSRHVHLPHE